MNPDDNIVEVNNERFGYELLELLQVIQCTFYTTQPSTEGYAASIISFVDQGELVSNHTYK